MFIDRITAALPRWLITPLSALSTLAALAGSGCLFAAAVFGAVAWAIGGLIAFVVAGLLWQIADRAATPG